MSKVIIVTGGASGIGKETAILLASEGAKIVVADINIDGAKEVAETIKNQGGEASAYQVDTSKKMNISALIDFTVETYGTLTGIFNNAGIGAMVPFKELKTEDYQKMIDINQTGVFLGIQLAANKMIELGVKNGVIVNTASIYGFVGAATSAHYNAAKAAVVSLTKSAAQAYTKEGIRVTAVAPGFTKTAILEAVDDEMLKAIESFHLREKLLSAKEIANVVAFLFSDKSVAVNGSTILADDGYLAFK
ncbi:MAG: SDR family NAD(P)-dependent oxidoreductase [Candidatus Izemoplasmataceae bacterium]